MNTKYKIVLNKNVIRMGNFFENINKQVKIIRIDIMNVNMLPIGYQLVYIIILGTISSRKRKNVGIPKSSTT